MRQKLSSYPGISLIFLFGIPSWVGTLVVSFKQAPSNFISSHLGAISLISHNVENKQRRKTLGQSQSGAHVGAAFLNNKSNHQSYEIKPQ